MKGRKDGVRERGREGKKEGRKEGWKEGGREGRKEGRKDSHQEFSHHLKSCKHESPSLGLMSNQCESPLHPCWRLVLLVWGRQRKKKNRKKRKQRNNKKGKPHTKEQACKKAINPSILRGEIVSHGGRNNCQLVLILPAQEFTRPSHTNHKHYAQVEKRAQ